VYPFTVKEIEDDIFSDDYNEFFSDGAALSENYKNFMKRWILGRDIEHEHFKQTWHSAEAADDANIEELRLKVKSIICEQLFTARAEHLGYKLTVTNAKTYGYRI
jgi:hypothetical protein